jgi:DNA-binding NtrC family response regulator
VTTQRRKVLAVAPTLTLANDLRIWFSEAGYEVTLATTFADGKAHLRTFPDVVITELRLGSYNGLHLALYADAADIPTVVVGDADPVLEADANRLGAMFVRVDEISREKMLPDVENLLSKAAWTRAEREFGEEPLTAEVASGLEWVIAAAPVRHKSTNHGRRPSLH